MIYAITEVASEFVVNESEEERPVKKKVLISFHEWWFSF